MSELQIAKRWAQALFNLGESEQAWKRGLAEVELKLNLLDDYPKFKKLLTSTKLPFKDKEALLFKIFEGRLDSKFLLFLTFLIKKNRFHYLPAIAREYSRRVKQHFGSLEARVITAVPLAEEIKLQLQKKIEAELQAQAVMLCEIDPTILGGVRVIIGNRILDGSLKTKLYRLNEKLTYLDV